MNRFITVFYSCNECGISKKAVQVRARPSADVDVVLWMNRVVTNAIGHDHFKTSPRCKTKTLSDVMIPTPKGTEFIGQGL